MQISLIRIKLTALFFKNWRDVTSLHCQEASQLASYEVAGSGWFKLGLTQKLRVFLFHSVLFLIIVMRLCAAQTLESLGLCSQIKSNPLAWYNKLTNSTQIWGVSAIDSFVLSIGHVAFFIVIAKVFLVLVHDVSFFVWTLLRICRQLWGPLIIY